MLYLMLLTIYKRTYSLKKCIYPDALINTSKYFLAGPNSRAFSGVGLGPLACWDCGFESRRRHGCSSVVSVVCCKIQVSAFGSVVCCKIQVSAFGSVVCCKIEVSAFQLITRPGESLRESCVCY